MNLQQTFLRGSQPLPTTSQVCILFEEEFVSDGFAYFDEFSRLAEGYDAVKQRVSFIGEFLLEAKSANGYTDFHSFSIA
jgi:hypothetical protein